jgi:opacity protein-like surface antigen
MKKILVVSIISLAAMAPQAFAQSGNFKGLSAGVGLNGADTTSEARLPAASYKGIDSDVNFSLQLQYNVALNEAYLLGLGTTVNSGDLKAGKLGLVGQIKVRDAYSLYVAPSYAFNNTWLGYAKLAYLFANAVSANGGSTKFDGGYGYGFGAQAMFTKNWFGQAEFMNNQYEDQSSLHENDKLKSKMYSLTAGYKF